MSYSADHFEEIAHAVRKNGRNVPKDQGELLNAPGSWIQNLKKRSHGLANVPTHVLQTVTAAYTATLERAKSSHGAPAAVTEAPREEPGPRSQATPASSPERAISDWSVSPEEGRQRTTHTVGSSMVEETPLAPQTRLPQRKSLQTDRYRLDVMPMSSLDEEEDMEVQLPRRADDEYEEEQESTNSSAQHIQTQQLRSQADMGVANTPPCAQPRHEVIPGTVAAEPSKLEQDNAKTRQHKRMKPIDLDFHGCSKPQDTISGAGATRMQSLKRLQMDTQETVVSSSIVPATLTQTQTPSVPAPSRRKAGWTPEIIEVESSGSTAGEEMAALQVKREDSDNAEDERETPLDEFTAAYPGYNASQNGTQTNFLKACLCLEYLRGERALRDYLYDEFIRLFSHKYLDYVNDAGPDQEPLSAIEWFNIQGGQPVYTRQVVHNQNLDQVLDFYGDEVAIIRGQVEQRDSEEVEETGEAQGPALPREEEQAEAMEVDLPQPVAAIVFEKPRAVASRATPATTREERGASTPVQRVTPRRVFEESPAQGSSRGASTAAAVQSPRVGSPQLGSTAFSAVPPSSIRSNAPVGTQYMLQLSSRQASTGEEDAQRRRERMRAALRKRASNSARSSSSKARSVV